MFSATVRDDKRLKCWKIMPMFLRSARSWDSFILVKSLSSMMTWPLVGFSNILMQRTSVDLPAPLLPMIPKISPSSMVRLMPFRAWTCAAPP